MLGLVAFARYHKAFEMVPSSQQTHISVDLNFAFPSPTWQNFSYKPKSFIYPCHKEASPSKDAEANLYLYDKGRFDETPAIKQPKAAQILSKNRNCNLNLYIVLINHKAAKVSAEL